MAPGADRWGDLGAATSPEVAAERRIVLVPLGSNEQHGPHLPLDTDTRVAVAIARGAADALADGVQVAPAVAFGASGEHQGFAGTLSIGTAALTQVIVELARSAGEDYSLLVFVNGHGGNWDAVDRARSTLADERRPVLFWSPRIDGADSHAGRTETSLLLAVDPSVVRLDRAEPGVTSPLSDLISDLRAGGVASVSPNGILGDPSGASADEGRALLADLVADLVTAVRSAAGWRR